MTPRSVTRLLIDRRASLSAADRSDMADRQTRLAARILTVANLANIASIVLTAAFMIPPGPFRVGWAVAMLAVITNSCRMWWPWVRNPQPPTFRSHRIRLMIDVQAGALLYAVLAIHVIPELSGAKQVVLVATFVGVVGSGAIALSSVRSVALAWIGTTFGGLAIGFLVDGSPQLPIEIAQFALYAVALVAAIEYLSWSSEQRFQAERAAERGRQDVTLLLDDFEGGARDWLWQTDPAGRFVSPSARFAERSVLPPAALEQLTLADLIDRHAVCDGDQLGRALAAAIAFRDIVVPVAAAGARRWWSLSGTPQPDGSWRGVGSDITDTREHEQQMLRLASFDPLTGLANRHTLASRLDAMVRDRADGQQIRLSILDLDNFKAVNDTLGHPMGDRLLAEVAGRLLGTMGADAICARLGGDEFAVVSSVDPADVSATGPASALASVLERPFDLDGTRLEIRGSVGQATFPDDAADADELVVLADLALYAAKAAGTGLVRRFVPSMRTAAEARSRAQRDLRMAIDDHAFELRFQPLVAPSGAVVAFEALARWNHPSHGWISPSSFIAVAEETGLIVPLGDQLLDQALVVAATLPERIRIAVNVAPAQLVSVGFVDRFRSALLLHGVTPDRIDVEVTESTVVDPNARATIEELRRSGCGVAVDDFGTGYSSFATLQDLPITQLKIDREFVRRLDLPAGSRAKAIVQAIVDVADASGLICVAEGVETEQQRAIVEELGCIVQGYLEAEPMAAADIPAYLARRA